MRLWYCLHRWESRSPPTLFAPTPPARLPRPAGGVLRFRPCGPASLSRNIQFLLGGNSFDCICRAFGVEYRLTKTVYLQTTGQVKRINRLIEEATLQRYHLPDYGELNEYL